MSFTYERTIHFADTDAAGVVYFANILNLCHEAYEASLIASGVELRKFFKNPDYALPITQTGANFFKPIFCGDGIQIQLTPQELSAEKFEISYQLLSSEGATLATATTQHLCIHPMERRRISLPSEIRHWLQQWS